MKADKYKFNAKIFCDYNKRNYKILTLTVNIL